MTATRPLDPDIKALRRAARRVVVQIGIATAVLVLLIVIAAFAYVSARVPPGVLFSRSHEAVLDVGGLDFLRGALLLAICAIVAAIVLSWSIAWRAVRPLGEALRLQRAFVANASHELRTPLAVLDARLQALQRKQRRNHQPLGELAELRKDTATLIGIVNDLLDIADDSPAGLADRTALSPVIGLAVESMRLLAADKRVTISWHPGEPLEVVASTAAIHRCLVALLDNAIKHAPNGSTVTVAAVRFGAVARMTVSDTGAGIRGIAPDRIFERFARGEDEPSSGFGIGLALVADTARRYRGTASVVRTGSDGTEFAIDLPLATQRRPASGRLSGERRAKSAINNAPPATTG